MKITYSIERNVVIEEKCEFDIVDRYNCFLKGTCSNNTPVYLGVFRCPKNNEMLNVVTVTIHNCTLELFALSPAIDQKIGQFIKNNQNVFECTENEFRDLFSKYMDIFGNGS